MNGLILVLVPAMTFPRATAVSQILELNSSSWRRRSRACLFLSSGRSAQSRKSPNSLSTLKAINLAFISNYCLQFQTILKWNQSLISKLTTCEQPWLGIMSARHTWYQPVGLVRQGSPSRSTLRRRAPVSIAVRPSCFLLCWPHPSEINREPKSINSSSHMF
jgi:hypothetical protein